MGCLSWAGGAGTRVTFLCAVAVLSLFSAVPAHCAPLSLPYPAIATPSNTSLQSPSEATSPIVSAAKLDVSVAPTQFHGMVTGGVPAAMGSITSQRQQVQEVILRTQKDLLRLIGLVDRSWEAFGDSLRNTTFHFFLDGQKAFGKAYHATPQFVNRFIQRIGTIFGSGGDQINRVFNLYRSNLKSFIDNWEIHEYDAHDVVQQRFKDINANLGVSPLPDYNFQWT